MSLATPELSCVDARRAAAQVFHRAEDVRLVRLSRLHRANVSRGHFRISEGAPMTPALRHASHWTQTRRSRQTATSTSRSPGSDYPLPKTASLHRCPAIAGSSCAAGCEELPPACASRSRSAMIRARARKVWSHSMSEFSLRRQVKPSVNEPCPLPSEQASAKPSENRCDLGLRRIPQT